MPSDAKPPIHDVRSAPGIVKSQDAGGYYCGHLFYLLHQIVNTPRSLRERFDTGPCVGFLHVPQDAWMTNRRDTRAPAERHLLLQEIWTDIFRGLYARQISELRLLISGFGAFAEVTHNPTQDFLENQNERLVHAINRAVAGKHQVQVRDWTLGPGGPSPHISRQSDDTLHLHSLISVADLKWTIGTAVFPVNDGCLQTGPDLGLGFFESFFRPNMAIAMGVARGESEFRVECVAKNDNLKKVEGGYAHAPDIWASETLPSNHWLWETYSAGVSACPNKPRKISMGN